MSHTNIENQFLQMIADILEAETGSVRAEQTFEKLGIDTALL